MTKNNIDNNCVFGLLAAYCMFYISILDFSFLAELRKMSMIVTLAHTRTSLE